MPTYVQNPDPVISAGLSEGLHPDHPLQKTYGHSVAADYVATANRNASAIRQWGGLTAPADTTSEMRDVGPGAHWFGVGGAPQHRNHNKRFPEFSVPAAQHGEDAPALAPDANTPETHAAMRNLVRTENENLSRQFTNHQIGVNMLPPVEVGGWLENGQAVHDVTDVLHHKGDQETRRTAQEVAKHLAANRGEREYFDAENVESIKTSKPLPWEDS